MSEKEVLARLVVTATSTGELVDKATSWGMAGVGASIMLILTNIKALICAFSSYDVKILLGLLLASLVFGLLSKIHYVIVAQASHIIAEVTEYRKEITKGLNKEELAIVENDISKAVGILRNKIRRWYSKVFLKDYTKPEAVKNHQFLIDVGKKFNRQLEFAYLMTLMVVAAIVYVMITL